MSRSYGFVWVVGALIMIDAFMVEAASCPTSRMHVNGTMVDLSSIGSSVFTEQEVYGNSSQGDYQFGIHLCKDAPALIPGPSEYCTELHGYFQVFTTFNSTPANGCEVMFNTMTAPPVVMDDSIVFNYKASCGSNCYTNGWTAQVALICAPGVMTLTPMEPIVISINSQDGTYDLLASLGHNALCGPAPTTSTVAPPPTTTPLRVLNCEGYDCDTNCSVQTYSQDQCFPYGSTPGESNSAKVHCVGGGSASGVVVYQTFKGSSCAPEAKSGTFNMSLNSCSNYIAPDGSLWSHMNLC